MIGYQIPQKSFKTIGVEKINIISSVSNTFLGYQSGVSNTTGEYNVGFGYQTLANNTEGVENSAVGYQALYSNTEGDSNMAFGRRSMYTNASGTANIAVGRNSLYYNVSGNNNTALGYNSLNGTTGSSNTAVGRNSGNSLGNASDNVFIGYEAGNHASQLVTAQNSIGIGYGVYTTESNTCKIGNSSITKVEFGGGTQMAYEANPTDLPEVLATVTNILAWLQSNKLQAAS